VLTDQTPEERMARAEALAEKLSCQYARNEAGLFAEVAALLRGLVADLREARAELATLRASVVAAMSSAGPEVGEDERAG
jgi:hypothetical protein